MRAGCNAPFESCLFLSFTNDLIDEPVIHCFMRIHKMIPIGFFQHVQSVDLFVVPISGYVFGVLSFSR